MNCLICGAPLARYSGTGRPRKYCSRSCSNRAHRNRIAGRKELSAGKPGPRECRHCGKAIEQSDGPGAPRIYCSRKCKRNGWWPMRPCTRCGKLFRSHGGTTKYCSRECRVTGKIEVPCTVCGEQFLRAGKHVKCCSLKCATIAGGETRRSVTRDAECPQCGKTFQASIYPKPQRFCSFRCQDRHHTRKKRHARRAGGAGEDISLVDLVDRDQGICQLCHKRVNRRLRHPHPMSASIDHIVPLSLGGLHSWQNVQLAHLSCNASKHNRAVGSQLRLSLEEASA